MLEMLNRFRAKPAGVPELPSVPSQFVLIQAGRERRLLTGEGVSLDPSGNVSDSDTMVALSVHGREDALDLRINWQSGWYQQARWGVNSVRDPNDKKRTIREFGTTFSRAVLISDAAGRNRIRGSNVCIDEDGKRVQGNCWVLEHRP